METIEISSSSEDEGIQYVLSAIIPKYEVLTFIARSTHKQPPKKTLGKAPSQVIEISSDSESENDFVHLLKGNKIPKPRPVVKERPLPLYADEDSSEELGLSFGAILHLYVACVFFPPDS